MTNEKNYQYAGNTVCGCCGDECLEIRITPANFDKYCRAPNGEWIHRVETDPRGEDKHYCEIWFKNRGEITIAGEELQYTDGNVNVWGFYSNWYDDKQTNQNFEWERHYSEGCKYVTTATFSLGNYHTATYVYTETFYNVEYGTRPDRHERKQVYIDGVLCYVEDFYGWHSTSSEGDDEFSNVPLIRKDGKVYVYSGIHYVGNFDDVPDAFFTYKKTFEYIGSSDKYISVTPTATWKKTYNCISYDEARCHQGTLSDSDKNAMEEARRYEAEHIDCCIYPHPLFTAFSPQIKVKILNAPDGYANFPSEIRPVSYRLRERGIPFEWQEASYCQIGDGKAGRLSVSGGGIFTTLCEGFQCTEIPYGATIEYTEYPNTCKGLTLISAPRYGNAQVIHGDDENGYERWLLRYTAPTSLPDGVCVDELQYKRKALYGEQVCGIRFKIYKDEWQDLSTPIIGYGLDVGDTFASNDPLFDCCCKRVLRLTVTGQSVDIGDSTDRTPSSDWTVELYGEVSAGTLTTDKIYNTEFKFIDGYSDWSYVSNYGGYTTRFDQDTYPNSDNRDAYQQAKNKISQIRAVYEEAPPRGDYFVHSTNNYVELCSNRDIKQIRINVGGKLVKRTVRVTQNGYGSTTSTSQIDSVDLPNHTYIIDGGESPAETAYADRFGVNYIDNMYFRIQIGEAQLMTSRNGLAIPVGSEMFITQMNGRSEYNANGDYVYIYDEVVYQPSGETVSIQYF